MDSRSTQTYMEDRTEAPGAQLSPDLSSTRNKMDAEPTISGVNQVALAEAAVRGSGTRPSSAPGGPEEWSGHTEASEEGPAELGTQEQRPPARPENKQSSWKAQEEPGEPGQNQAKRGSELGLLPARLPATPEGLQGPGMEREDQQERWPTPSTVEDQPPESRQGSEFQSPGHQAANASGMGQPTEPSCALDSCGWPLGDDVPGEADTPYIRPQEALPEPSAGGHEDSSQEAMPLMALATAEERMAKPLSPFTPGPETPTDEGRAVEIQPAPEPLPKLEARDIGEKRGPDHAQKQLQESEGPMGGPSPGNPWQGFMKCLLEVEEEEATHRRASKARTPTARKSPRTLTPVPTSVPASSSVPSLLLTLAQTPTSALATVPLWARPPAPGRPPSPMGAPVPAPVPSPVLPVPAMDLGWRRTEFLSQSNDRSLSYTKARQELEERSLVKLYHSWEEQSEEHLTQKQEEAFRSYFEIFDGPGEVDAQSLKNILLLVGFSLTPAQVEDALMSADIDGDGHVDFKDFLAVMTDTKRFFCSVEQNALTNMAPPNPHTLLFEILSLLVEMLALPEAALEEITNYYQKKLKEGTCKAREMESAIGRLRSRKKISYNPQQAEGLEVPDRRVLRILSRLKQQNYAANLQSPYAQVPCIPLCPRMDKKMVRRKQGNHYVLDPCTPIGLGPDIRSFFFHSGPQGSRKRSPLPGHADGSRPGRTVEGQTSPTLLSHPSPGNTARTVASGSALCQLEPTDPLES